MSLTRHEPRDVAQQPERLPAEQEGGVLDTIRRAASDPSVDMDKFERLIAMQERLEERAARRAYAADLAMMQSDLPVVARNGRIIVRAKNSGPTGRILQNTPYALWEDINAAILPKLRENGFALSFRCGQTPEGKVTVTGILSHRAGHFEETTVTLLQDSSGSKNGVQAVGSSISYGKRYAAGLLLNITSRGEDDDGKAAGDVDEKDPETLSADQIATIRKRLEEVGKEEGKLLDFVRYPALEDVPVTMFDQIMATLNRGKGRR